jgi:hypothetical protein
VHHYFYHHLQIEALPPLMAVEESSLSSAIRTDEKRTHNQLKIAWIRIEVRLIVDRLLFFTLLYVHLYPGGPFCLRSTNSGLDRGHYLGITRHPTTNEVHPLAIQLGDLLGFPIRITQHPLCEKLLGKVDIRVRQVWMRQFEGIPNLWM